MKRNEAYLIAMEELQKSKIWNEVFHKAPDKEFQAFLTGFEQGAMTLIQRLSNLNILDDSAQKRFDLRMQEEAEVSLKIARKFR
mgnify:CR=1 FL=1